MHESSFAEAPSRTQEPEDLAGLSISWTADGGFASQSSRMRMIGQRPSADDAGLDAAVSEEPGAPELRYLPAAGPRHERPPRDVVDIVEQATGVRVGDTIIDRSPEISDRASDMGAIAFTEAGTVHLPAELGDINELQNKAIVAHELTHVAQQQSRRHVPSEDSPEGRELEAEAREMQRRFGGVVRPHFMRRRPGSVDVAAGVQRLAGDDDAYAWQQRGESPSQGSVLGAFGFSVAAGSERERRQQPRTNSGHASSRRTHAQHLNELRERHYHELKEEVLRQKRITAFREDEAAPTSLDRHEMLELRGQLDDDMPWEFGFPEHLAHAYPEALPPEEEHPEGEHHGEQHEGEHHEAGQGEHHTTTHGHGAALAAGAHATGRRHLTTTGTGHGAAHGRTPGALGHGRGRTAGGPGAHAGGDHENSQFDWQHRESTDHEVVEALFGGGLFGGLLGLAVGADTDETRANAERSTPQLHERRKDRERELRHTALQTKHNEHVRNDDPAAAVTLSHAEVIAIREQLDQEMPLQYVTPEYLDQHDDARMTAEGTFGPAATLAADDDAHGGAEHHDAAHPAGTQAAAGAGASGATPATDTATATPTQDTDTDGRACGRRRRPSRPRAGQDGFGRRRRRSDRPPTR